MAGQAHWDPGTAARLTWSDAGQHDQGATKRNIKTDLKGGFLRLDPKPGIVAKLSERFRAPHFDHQRGREVTVDA
jgi:hypothetical protein